VKTPLTARILLLAALLAPLPAAAQGPVLSTAPVQAASPLMLSFSKDSRMSRVGLDYAVKWDFSDLASFKPTLGNVYSGIKAVTSWDITENTRVEYYGFRTNPWRLIIAKKKAEPQPAQPADGGPSPVVKQDVGGARKSFHLSLSPLVDDLQRSFDTGLSDFLLRNSLRKASPEWERIGQQNRKAVVRDVLALPIWQAPVPGVDTTKEGLEYISK
jgi:hypothetical protein